jgi:hypothetical protein
LSDSPPERCQRFIKVTAISASCVIPALQ